MISTIVLAALGGQLVQDARFPAELQQRALDATVLVFHPSTLGEGSGVVIRYENGFAFILTAAHIVPEKGEKPNEIEVSFFPRGKPRNEVLPIKTEVTSRMLNEDLAIIRMGLKQPPPGILPLCPKSEAPSKWLEKPLAVLALGLGAGRSPEAAVDRIQEHKLVKKPDGTEAFHWEADSPQPIGRSGGPLVDTKGRVIGICSGRKDKKGYYLSIYEIEAALRKNSWDFLNPPAVSSDSKTNPEKNGPDGKKN